MANTTPNKLGLQRPRQARPRAGDPHRLSMAIAVVVVWLAAAGCGSTSATGTTPTKHPSVSTASVGARPGTLANAQQVAQPTINPPSTLWRIKYHSRNRTGSDIVVSGFAMVPKAPAPSGGRPVFAWAHGTTGLGDQCAPSRDIRNNLAPYGYEQLLAGAVIVQTDYEGLGTPSEHTYLDGVSEGHAVLDSIRAARQLPGVGSITGAVIAGQSQGGGAALWAAQLAHEYAPEIDLRGVLALAPAAELTTIAAALPNSPYRGLLLLAADGLRASYGSAFDPAKFLTPAANADLSKAAGECVDETVRRYQDASAGAIVTRSPNTVPEVRRILEENSPGATAPGVPVMLAQGSRDQQIPLTVTARLDRKYCQLGATVIRRVEPGADHDGVVDAAHDEAIAWIADRFAKRPAPSDCSAAAQPSTGSSNK